jgi:gluconolactonase
MYRLDLDTQQLEIINSNPKMLMANGADKRPERKNILSLTQGFNATGGGVYQLDRETLKSTPIVETYFGVPFNSLNDIASTTDGILFFSDPVYGFEQGFRVGEPQLGSKVYRYDMATKELTII